MSADSKLSLVEATVPPSTPDVLEEPHLRVVGPNTASALGEVGLQDEARPVGVIDVPEVVGERALRVFKINAHERISAAKAEAEAFKKQFSSRQQEVIASLFRDAKDVGDELNISEDTVGFHIRAAKVVVGTKSTPYLAVLAARHGMIPMKGIPSGLTLRLSEEQQMFMQQHYRLKHKQTAKILRISPEAVALRWSDIYAKLGEGIKNQTQATLAAYKDGLIA